ncbi:MAG: protein BatD [Planctomycetes bacterium]|nr:protein BatD [Planctomycetota bacterium]
MIRTGWVAAVIFLISTVQADAQPIRVGAAVQREIYVGEPFQFQIQIDGFEQAGVVDLGPLAAFSPRSMGGHNQSSSRTTIDINGQMTQSKTLRYIMAYQLTAPSAGQVRIPSLTVEVGGQKCTTNPININVLKPGVTDKIGLEMGISQTDCYVGQPLVLKMTWYVGASLGSFSFNIPALRDTEHFVVEEMQTPPDTGGKLIQIELDGTTINARQKDGVYQGNKCLEIIFGRILIPVKPGTTQIGGASVICNIEVSSRGRSRNPMDDFFSGGLFSRREYERFSSSAPGMTLEVKELPGKGRPADFNGLAGRYSIATTASPIKVNVGDPITLTIMVGGELLRLVDMPDLTAMPEMADNFRIPTSQSVPKVSGNRKIFTQTIRAIHDQVTEIPAIPLSYFDVDQGAYFTTYSDPIPLEVMETKVVTAGQAISAQVASQASEIEAVRIGIAANYEGPELLKNTAFSPMTAIAQPGYIVLWIGPMGLLITSGLVRILRQNSSERQQARRKARSGSQAIRQLKRMDGNSKSAAEQAADIMRHYVGDRFNQTSQSLTAKDCRLILSENCGHQQVVNQFCGLLEQCEQSRFAGGLAESDSVDQREIKEAIKALDKQLKS